MVADTDTMSEVNQARTNRLANALKTKSSDLERSQSMRNRARNHQPDQAPIAICHGDQRQSSGYQRQNAEDHQHVCADQRQFTGYQRQISGDQQTITGDQPKIADDHLIVNEFRRRAATMPSKENMTVPSATLSQSLFQPTTLPLKSASRVSSIDAGEESIVVERMRTFTLDTEKAAVINRGDSFRCRSHTFAINGSSKNSSNRSSRHSPIPQEALTSPISPFELLSPNWAEDGVKSYHVIVIGSAGVGKTSMINQFMTSDYCNPFQYESCKMMKESAYTRRPTFPFLAGIPEDNSVTVLLDGEESRLTFIEVNNNKSDMWLSLSGAAYIVAYSVDDLSSFRNAEQALYELRQRAHAAKKPIILVANKIDLERKRHVTNEDGKRRAKEWNCKFVEIAVALGHHVDELLVGVLAQIRMDESNEMAISGLGSKSELLFALDAVHFHDRTSSSSSCGSTCGSRSSKRRSRKQVEKDIQTRRNKVEKCNSTSMKKMDQVAGTGRAHISSVGEKFVQTFLGWRRRSHSLEDLLAWQKR